MRWCFRHQEEQGLKQKLSNKKVTITLKTFKKLFVFVDWNLIPVTNPLHHLILWRLRIIIHNWWSRNGTGSGSRPPKGLLWWWDSRPPLPICQTFLPFITTSVLFLLCAWYFDQTGLDPGPGPWTLDPEHSHVLSPWALKSDCFFPGQVLPFLFPVKILPVIPGSAGEVFLNFPNEWSSLFQLWQSFCSVCASNTPPHFLPLGVPIVLAWCPPSMASLTGQVGTKLMLQRHYLFA